MAAGLRPPFIVSGHSYGGLLARAFAARAVLSGLHDDFARRVKDGTHIECSGHSIQLDEPELVIAAIRKVMTQADARGR